MTCGRVMLRRAEPWWLLRSHESWHGRLLSHTAASAGVRPANAQGVCQYGLKVMGVKVGRNAASSTSPYTIRSLTIGCGVAVRCGWWGLLWARMGWAFDGV